MFVENANFQPKYYCMRVLVPLANQAVNLQV